MKQLIYPKSSQPIRHEIAPDDPFCIDTVRGITAITLNGAPFPVLGAYGQSFTPGDVLEVTPGPDGGAITGYFDAAHEDSNMSLRIRSSLIDLWDNEPGHPDDPFAQRVAFTLAEGQGFKALYVWGDTLAATVDLSSASTGQSVSTPALTPLGLMQDPYGGTVTVYRPDFNQLAAGAYWLTVTGGNPFVSELGGTTLGQYGAARVTRATGVGYEQQASDGGAWTPTPYGLSVQMDRYVPPPLHTLHGDTTYRPSVWPPNLPFFDTTLGKPIWRKVSGLWVDANGTAV